MNSFIRCLIVDHSRLVQNAILLYNRQAVPLPKKSYLSGGEGKRIRKALKISRKKEDNAVKERAEMAIQATKLASSKHRGGLKYEVEVGA